MFGHQSGPSKIYEYGCTSAPGVGLAVFEKQVKLAHRYRNALVAIERQRRDAFADVLGEQDEVKAQKLLIESLQTQLEAKRKEAKAASAAERRRVAPGPEMAATIKALTAQLKTARARLRELKPAAIAASKPALDQATADAQQAVRDARAASGLYWGTYLAVEQGMAAARSGPPPRFRRFDGSGKVAVQIQHGISVGDLFGCEDTRLQIKPVPPEAWSSPVRGERRRLSRTVARLRVGTERDAEGRRSQPIWVEVPIVLHRPLPEGCRVKWAYLLRERVATKFEYRLQLVIEQATGFAVPTPEDPSARIGVDIGWRVVGSGLRVAYWRDSQGREGEIVLPEELLGRFRQVEDLRSIRDGHFNVARQELVTWLKTRQNGDLSEEWQARVRTVAQWRASARLAALALWWRTHRLPDDCGAFAAVEDWRKKDKHLSEWQANLHQKARRNRREMYRRFAAHLARTYGTACLEEFDLRQMAKLKEVEEMDVEQETPLPIRRARVIAACSILRLAIVGTGIGVETVPSAYTTLRCAQCGYTNSFDLAASIWQTCAQCGEAWDQDANAARNLVEYVAGDGCERLGDA